MSAASDACPRLEYDRRVSEASASSAGDSSNSKDATWTEKNGRYAHPDASAGADAPALGEEAGFSTLERLVSLVGQADEPPCVPVPLAGLDAAAETGDSTRMGDGPAVLPRAKLIILGVGAMFTFFLATISTTATTLVLPQISADLGLPALQTQWILSSYSLAYGCGLLFSGRLADIYGRRFLYFFGLGVYMVLTLVSGAIRQHIALCVVRAFAGLGLAIASPSLFGIIGTLVRTEPHRTIIFASLGLGGPIGAGLGALIGGSMAGIGRHGWTYLFFFMGASTLCPIMCGLLVIPRGRPSEPGSNKRVDWAGGAMCTVGCALLLFSITQSGSAARGWRTPYIPALFALSVVILVAFILYERHLERRMGPTSTPPVLKPSMFTRHGGLISAIIACAIVVTYSVYGWVYLVAIYYQEVKGFTPLNNALHVIPCNVAGLLAVVSAMFLNSRVKAPILFAVGGTCTALTSILYAAEPAGTSYWACEFVAQLLTPYGIDWIVAIGQVMVSNLVEEDEQSVGGALFQTAQQLSISLSICLCSLTYTEVQKNTGDLYSGVRAAGWLNGAVGLLAPFICLVALRKVGIGRDVGKQVRAEQHAMLPSGYTTRAHSTADLAKAERVV